MRKVVMGWRRMALLVLAILASGIYFAPAYKANPDYVRSASTVAIMGQFEDARLISGIKVERGGAPDISKVTGQAAASKIKATSGFLTREDTNYSFELLTRSHCFELEPACLEILQTNIIKAVSVKVIM